LPALIEATANQVNQDGGYTGKTPAEFFKWCHDIAKSEDFDTSKLILGGDHLGPLTWTNLDETEAMIKAKKLISEYVLAGFTKIHIDTSMHLASDDPAIPLSDEIIAGRGARLCAAAEVAAEKRHMENPDAVYPVYVIGSEVPVPGGSQNHEGLDITSRENCIGTISAFRKAFIENDLTGAWERVIAVVVQPGVEFSEDEVFVYNSDKAKELYGTISETGLVFEGHSTDYQPRPALRELVSDGVIILKVGPALTFALREVLFALENIEKTTLSGHETELSNFSEVLETVMLAKPEYWKNHYHGDENKLKISRAFSYSDRARYYLHEPVVSEAIHRLKANLDKPVALPLLSQFLPVQYTRVRDGTLDNMVDELIIDKIGDCLDDYIFAIVP